MSITSSLNNKVTSQSYRVPTVLVGYRWRPLKAYEYTNFFEAKTVAQLRNRKIQKKNRKTGKIQKKVFHDSVSECVEQGNSEFFFVNKF